MQSTDKLLLYGNQSYKLVGGQGFLLSPQPEFVRAILSTSADLQMNLSASSNLASPNASLFCITKNDPDALVGILFVYKGTKQALLAYGLTPWCEYYEPKSWFELRCDGEPGFLITGPNENSVWRIVRAEPDHLKRARLTLRPVAAAVGLPHADFSRVRDHQLRRSIESSWTKLQDHLANKHGDEVVTASKNVLEGLFADVLESAGQPHGGSLAEKLDRLEMLQDGMNP